MQKRIFSFFLHQRSILILMLLTVLLVSLTSLPLFVVTNSQDGTQSIIGIIALLIFVAAYAFVIFEDRLELEKSKPMLMSAGILWFLTAYFYNSIGKEKELHVLLEHNLLEYGELFLFLLVAMTYVNTIEEREVFQRMKVILVSKGFSLRSLFGITGIVSFFLSAVADNLTTALIMSSVVMAVGKGNNKFIVAALINIVVAANAGGAWCPFGDITTLMVWQRGTVGFFEFFALFIPSLVSWAIPAVYMAYFAFENTVPEKISEHVEIKKGGLIICVLFVITIAISVLGYQVLHLPPVVGMMTGFGLLKVYTYFLTRYEHAVLPETGPEDMVTTDDQVPVFDIFDQVRRAEWDTLLFFYGVIMSVGALGALGYLTLLSHSVYGSVPFSIANVFVGVISAFVDNIPVMFAVLEMNPSMDLQQWLLVTYAAGTGGSMLALGSAAGVALMGQARGVYTFNAHLKYSFPIAIGYLAGAYVHLLIN